MSRDHNKNSIWPFQRHEQKIYYRRWKRPYDCKSRYAWKRFINVIRFIDFKKFALDLKFILFNPFRSASLSTFSTQMPISITNISRFSIDFAFTNLFIPSVIHPFTTAVSIISLYIIIIRLFNCADSFLLFISSPITLSSRSIYPHNLIYISLRIELFFQRESIYSYLS